MNLTTHQVAPEEIMAWLDGELSSAEARAVAAHVDDCVECANLATRFRNTTQVLSGWTVPHVSAQLENSVTELAQQKSTSNNLPKQKLFVRPSFWTWKQWALGAGFAASVIFVAISASIFHSSRSVQSVSKPRMLTFISPQPESRSIDGQGIAEQSAIPLRGKAEQMNSLTTFAPGLVGVQGSVGGNQPSAPPPSPVAKGKSSSLGIAVSPVTPMIARTASLTILVKDIATARSSLDVIVTEHRGYSAQITVDLSDSAPPRGIVASLRVPASELPSALANLRAIGRVEREKQSGEEVTQQHTDLVARLQNSRETEQRLRDILAQRTGKIEDVLQVEEEIARVRGEIESMEADQEALQHRVDFATIDVELVEEYKAQFNSPNASASIRMHNAFVAGMHKASDTLLGVVLFFEEYGPVLLIWLVILGIPVILVWRRYRRVQSKI